ncbi:Na(+)/citrate cotransporter-like [Glandiceps talaboti]
MGGSASLVGTAQVIVLKQFIDDCLCRQRKCCSIKSKKYQVDKKCSIRVYIRAELKALGPVSWAEGSVLVLFILSVLVWFFADPVIFPGWVQLDKGGYVSITTASVLIPISIFILPADPRGAYRRFKKDVKRRFEWEKLMDMKTMQAKYPWLIIFIVLGCLLSMGKAAQASGLSSWVANQLSDIRLLDPWVIVLILTVAIAILCEALGNVSVVVFVLPILSDLADDMQVNPLYFIVPSVLAASFAFMLPVASGPNIIAYSYGNLKVMDMVKAGFPMNIICIVIVNICTHTLCVWVFDIYTFPDWAQRPRGIPNTTMPTTLNSTTYDMLQT